MPKYEVTTSTGSIYRIDTEEMKWAKNGYDFQALTTLAMGEWDGSRSNVPDFHSWEPSSKPIVGSNMYIQGRGMHDWCLTTPIERIEILEEWSDE